MSHALQNYLMNHLLIDQYYFSEIPHVIIAVASGELVHRDERSPRLRNLEVEKTRQATRTKNE